MQHFFYQGTEKVSSRSLQSRFPSAHLGFHQFSTRWWFQIFFMFTPILGEDEPILTNIFQLGWFNHQLVKLLPSKVPAFVRLKRGWTYSGGLGWQRLACKFSSWRCCLCIWKGGNCWVLQIGLPATLLEKLCFNVTGRVELDVQVFWWFHG